MWFFNSSMLDINKEVAKQQRHARVKRAFAVLSQLDRK